MKRKCLVILAAFGGLVLAPLAASACGWWGESLGEPVQETVTVPGADEDTIDLSTPEGKARMAHAYLKGDGVPQDALVARRWMKQAALAGHAGAMNDYAVMLEKGIGGPEDQAQAARWFRASAEAGSARAAHSLADMLFEGRGVARDPKEAAQFLRQAAEAGHPSAVAGLARRIWAGEIAASEPHEGCLWSLVAAGLGKEGGAQACHEHAPDIGQAEMARLQAAATEKLASITKEEPRS